MKSNIIMPFNPVLLTAACGFLTLIRVVADPEAQPVRYARFFAVGDSPPFRQEIRDGVRYEIDPPPDSIPPREIVPGFGKESAAAVVIHLGRISTPVAVPEGKGPLDLRRPGTAPGAEPWVRLNRPETGDFLVYLWRDRTQATWKNATSLIVPDGSAGAAADTARIVNLFPLAVRILWGHEALILPAGKSIQRTVIPGADVPFQILVPESSAAPASFKRYYASTITQNHGERGWITIYRADGEAPRRPLKVTTLREPVPPAPPPPKPPDNR